MVILTCVPEVIGEISKGIHESTTSGKARLSSVLCFTRWAVYHPFRILRRNIIIFLLWRYDGKAYINSNIVNILGRSTDEDNIPMPELLIELGKKRISSTDACTEIDIKDSYGGYRL